MGCASPRGQDRLFLAAGAAPMARLQRQGITPHIRRSSSASRQEGLVVAKCLRTRMKTRIVIRSCVLTLGGCALHHRIGRAYPTDAERAQSRPGAAPRRGSGSELDDTFPRYRDQPIVGSNHYNHDLKAAAARWKLHAMRCEWLPHRSIRASRESSREVQGRISEATSLAASSPELGEYPGVATAAATSE